MAIQITLLEDTDVLLPTDFYRFTEVWYAGQSDDFTETSVYGGGAVNFFRWMRLDREHGSLGWYGKTVKEVCNIIPHRPHQYAPCYEFARGDIPVSHQVPETKIEKRARAGNLIVNFGQYKGKTVSQISQENYRYIIWLYHNTTVFDDFSRDDVSEYM
jgi:hypothetical protein